MYNREIWFWQDRQLDRETPRDAIDQLRAALSAGGLPTRKGFFTDVPDRIDWPEQNGYRPEHEEGHGRQALVAILTDGEGLFNRLVSARHQLATERLLRDLRHWPWLCVVDCSESGTRLEVLLGKYGIETIGLQDLPQWLGGTVTRTPSAAPLGRAFYGDERVWVAALALGGREVSRSSAQSLRIALGLHCSPWRVDDVIEGARQFGATQIDWLMRNASLATDATPIPGSMAYQALAWWVQRYTEAQHQRQAQENPLLPWSESLASRRWLVSQALLHLYLNPDGAAQRLVELAHGDLKKEIRSHLSKYAGAEHRGQRDDCHTRYMTWRLSDQSDITRHRLRQLGFAARVAGDEVASLKVPGRLVMAGTVLILLALTAFGIAGYHGLAPEPPELIVEDPFSESEAFEAQTVKLVESIGGGKFEVTIGSARHAVSLISTAGAKIPVKWTWHQRSNLKGLKGNVVLSTGRLAQPIRACSKNWPKRSLVVIAVPYEGDETSKAARQLAIQLLDKGSADEVLLGAQWEKAFPDWLGESRALNRNTQVLVILPQSEDAKAAARRLENHLGAWGVGRSNDLARLARDIKGGDSEAVADVLPQLEVYRQRLMVRVSGGPKKIGPDPNGMEWVRVCPGTLTMGTIDKNEDPMAKEDEMVTNQRTVVLAGFDMASTETTEAHDGQVANLPKVDVTWQEAREFCRDKAAGDIPTEAQWEYAARGGSRFPWSFGDDAAWLPHYAWYGERGAERQEVRQKLPNPLGLYDMHGNVWEWTRDWYSDYKSGIFVNPVGENSRKCSLEKGECRVVRGGSIVYLPQDLRSAARIEAIPALRDLRLGFRCVRVLSDF